MKDEKLEKRENIKIIALSVFIVLLIGLLVYFLFIKKDDNVNNIENNEEANVVVKNVYKTSDGKFTLKVVDKDNQEIIEKIKKEINKGGNEVDLDFDRMVAYGYLNDYILMFNDVKEDENYALYHGDFADMLGMQYSRVFLLDKNKGLILEKPNRASGGRERFGGEGNGLSYIKTSSGYFFACYLPSEVAGEVATIYTTDWKELGYADLSKIKVDEKGIYVYKSYDDNYKLKGDAVKYDTKGNLLEK